MQLCLFRTDFTRSNQQFVAIELQESIQERKIQEKLRENAFDVFMEEEKARESREIDELTSYTYGQKKVEEALEEIVEVDSAEITDVMAEEDPERNMDGNTEEDIQQ